MKKWLEDLMEILAFLVQIGLIAMSSAFLSIATTIALYGKTVDQGWNSTEAGFCLALGAGLFSGLIFFNTFMQRIARALEKLSRAEASKPEEIK